MKKFSIKIVLRLDKIKRSGDIPLYFSITVNNHTTRIPTGQHIKLTDWNTKLNCLKTHTKVNQMIEALLTDRMNKWKLYMYNLQANNKPITFDIGKAFFKNDGPQKLYEFIEQEIERWKDDKVENTLKTYRLTLNALREFKPKADFGDIDTRFIEDFDKFLAIKRGNSVNGRWVKHKCFRTIIRQAIIHKKINKDDDPYYAFTIKSEASQRCYLTTEEVTAIRTLDIPEKNGFLNKVRDIFLLACFTGLRYSDIMSLTFEHIKSDPDMIELIMQKTQKPVLIPLFPEAKAIIDKYGKHKIKTVGLTIMPKMTNHRSDPDLRQSFSI